MSFQKAHKKGVHASTFQSFLQIKKFLLGLPLPLSQGRIDVQVLQEKTASQDMK